MPQDVYRLKDGAVPQTDGNVKVFEISAHTAYDKRGTQKRWMLGANGRTAENQQPPRASRWTCTKSPEYAHFSTLPLTKFRYRPSVPKRQRHTVNKLTEETV